MLNLKAVASIATIVSSVGIITVSSAVSLSGEFDERPIEKRQSGAKLKTEQPEEEKPHEENSPAQGELQEEQTSKLKVEDEQATEESRKDKPVEINTEEKPAEEQSYDENRQPGEEPQAEQLVEAQHHEEDKQPGEEQKEEEQIENLQPVEEPKEKQPEEERPHEENSPETEEQKDNSQVQAEQLSELKPKVDDEQVIEESRKDTLVEIQKEKQQQSPQQHEEKEQMENNQEEVRVKVGGKMRKSSNRIEVSDPERSFYSCVDAFVYGYQMSYQNTSFWYKKTFVNVVTEEQDVDVAKSFFDQKVQENCGKRLKAAEIKNPTISDDLFNSYKTDQDFWLKKGSLPTSKQQRAFNELTVEQLKCVSQAASEFTIISDSKFRHKSEIKPISDFESSFIQDTNSCIDNTEKIANILKTYQIYSRHNTQTVRYFYLISYLTTNLSARQRILQDLKIIKWKDKTGMCDIFSSHIDAVLQSTRFFKGKLILSTKPYETKTEFKNAGKEQMKRYEDCQIENMSELDEKLDLLFEKYYVDGKGITQLSGTINDRVVKQGERRHNIKTKIFLSTNDNIGSQRAYIDTREYAFYDFYNVLDINGNASPTPQPPTTPCTQQYCKGTGNIPNPPANVGFDQHDILMFAGDPDKTVTLTANTFKNFKDNVLKELIVDIEIFLEEYGDEHE